MAEKPKPKATSKVLNQAVEEIFALLLEKETTTLVHDFGRLLRSGELDLDAVQELQPNPPEIEIVDDPDVDIFGQSLHKVPNCDCECPKCKRAMSASRFTQHLDKCLGMGRMSSRIANQRVLSNTAINTSQENIGLNMDTISKAIDAVVAGPSYSGDFTYTTNSGGNSGFQTHTQSTESASESTVVVAKTSPSASKPAVSKRRVRKRSSSPSEQTVVPPKASSSPSKRRVRNPASSPSKRTKASAVAPPLGLYEDISGDSSEDEFEDVSEMGWLDQESHSKAK